MDNASATVAGVSDCHIQRVIAGDQHADGRARGMLCGIGQGLGSEEIGGGEDGVVDKRKRVRSTDGDVRAVFGSGGFDGFDKSAVRQFARVNPVHGAAQGIEAVFEVAGGGVEKRGVGLKLCFAELHGSGHEILLRAIVQVALNAQALDLVRFRNFAPGRRELVNCSRRLALVVLLPPHAHEGSGVVLALPVFGSLRHGGDAQQTVKWNHA